jgi:hypothetical protein
VTEALVAAWAVGLSTAVATGEALALGAAAGAGAGVEVAAGGFLIRACWLTVLLDTDDWREDGRESVCERLPQIIPHYQYRTLRLRGVRKKF